MPLSSKEMYKMGLRVAGKTGEAKLKVSLFLEIPELHIINHLIMKCMLLLKVMTSNFIFSRCYVL